MRVIEYRLEGVSDAEPIYRLLTSVLDPQQAPAQELAALYHERWEIETALDELKTHLRGARIVLRSKTPELVRQEFYGLLMAHFAVRALMHEAALRRYICPASPVQPLAQHPGEPRRQTCAAVGIRRLFDRLDIVAFDPVCGDAGRG